MSAAGASRISVEAAHVFQMLAAVLQLGCCNCRELGRPVHCSTSGDTARRAELMGPATLQIAKTAFPKFKPMLVPPAPWRSANTGAHLTMRSFVMRTREQQANRKLLEAADREMAEGKPGASQVMLATHGCATKFKSALRNV